MGNYFQLHSWEEEILDSNSWVALKKKLFHDEPFYIIELLNISDVITEDINLIPSMLKWKYITEQCEENDFKNEIKRHEIMKRLDDIENSESIQHIKTDIWIIECQCSLYGKTGTLSLSRSEIQFFDEDIRFHHLLESIKSIENLNNRKILIETDFGDTYILKEFKGLRRRAIYDMIITLWELVHNQIILKKEKTTEEQREFLPTPISSIQGIHKVHQDNQLSLIFKQYQPQCLYAIPCSIKEGNLRLFSHGMLYISTLRLYFSSFKNGKPVHIVIPFDEIDMFDEIQGDRPMIGIHTGCLHFLISGPVSKIVYGLKKCKRLRQTYGSSTYKDMNEKLSLIKSPLRISYQSNSSLMIITHHFVEYSFNGFDTEERHLLWQFLSLSLYNMLRMEKNNYYQHLLDRVEQCGSTNWKISIEEDIGRSFSDVQDANMISSLRNILSCFHIHCPRIGYCQAMNIVGGFLLLHMNEINSFYLLDAICQNMLSNFYSKTISGVMINQKVFELFVIEKIPDVYNHMISLDVPFELLTTSWFMCIFIGILPDPLVLRIMDRFFLDGIVVLHQAALTILSLKCDPILNEENGFNIPPLLKNLHFNTEIFLNEMKKFQELNTEKYQTALRISKHRYINEMIEEQ